MCTLAMNPRCKQRTGINNKAFAKLVVGPFVRHVTWSLEDDLLIEAKASGLVLHRSQSEDNEEDSELTAGPGRGSHLRRFFVCYASEYLLFYAARDGGGTDGFWTPFVARSLGTGIGGQGQSSAVGKPLGGTWVH
jgi:hypothetical protein